MVNNQPATMPDEQIFNEWLEIGTIMAPQGLKGELRIAANSDFPERFVQPGKRWLLAPESSLPQEVELLEGRNIPGKNLYVVRLAEIQAREQAEALRGYKLLVPKSDRPQLAENEYHVSDLINLEVYNQLTGENIGVVSDIFWAGNDLLEVKLHHQPIPEAVSPPNLANVTRKSKLRKIKSKPNKIATVLIPFVQEIVPVVNLKAGCLEIIPPPGLLDLNQT